KITEDNVSIDISITSFSYSLRSPAFGFITGNAASGSTFAYPFEDGECIILLFDEAGNHSENSVVVDTTLENAYWEITGTTGVEDINDPAFDSDPIFEAPGDFKDGAMGISPEVVSTIVPMCPLGYDILGGFREDYYYKDMFTISGAHITSDSDRGGIVQSYVEDPSGEIPAMISIEDCPEDAGAVTIPAPYDGYYSKLNNDLKAGGLSDKLVAQIDIDGTIYSLDPGEANFAEPEDFAAGEEFKVSVPTAAPYAVGCPPIDVEAETDCYLAEYELSASLSDCDCNVTLSNVKIPAQMGIEVLHLSVSINAGGVFKKTDEMTDYSGSSFTIVGWEKDRGGHCAGGCSFEFEVAPDESQNPVLSVSVIDAPNTKADTKSSVSEPLCACDSEDSEEGNPASPLVNPNQAPPASNTLPAPFGITDNSTTGGGVDVSSEKQFLSKIFDASGRITKVIYDDTTGNGTTEKPEATFVYDDVNKTITSKDRTSPEVIFYYDNDFKLMTKKEIPSKDVAYHYTYTASNTLDTITLKDMNDVVIKVTKYNYDGLGVFTGTTQDFGGPNEQSNARSSTAYSQSITGYGGLTTVFNYRDETADAYGLNPEVVKVKDGVVNPDGTSTKINYASLYKNSENFDATTNVQIRVKTTDPLVNFLDGYYDLVNGLFVKTSATHVCYYTLTRDVNLQPINRLSAYENGVLVYDETQVAHQDLYQSETSVFVNNTRAYIVTVFIAFSQKSIEFYDSNPGGAELQKIELLEYDNEGEVIIRRVRETLNGPDLSYSKVVSSTNGNGDGIITTSKMFEGQEVSMIEEYDTFGNMVKMTEYNGAVTLYEYLTSDPELESDGLVTKVTDDSGDSIFYKYDTFGRVVLTWGSTTTPGLTTYNANGLIETFERKKYIPQPGDENLTIEQYQYGPILSVHRYVYDGQNLVTSSVEDELSTIVYSESWTYNSMGQTETYTNFAGTVTKYFYDSLDRQFKIVEDFGGMDITETTTYNANGFAYRVDKEGAIMQTEYDAFIRLSVVTQDPDGFALASTNSYDFNGNLSVVTDSEGNQIIFEYDGLNRDIKTTDERGVISTKEYDINGNLIKEIEDEGFGRRNITVEYEYNNMDERIKEIKDPNETFEIINTFNYNLIGQIVLHIGNLGVSQIKSVYEYDEYGNQTKLTVDSDGVQKIIEFLYDEFGRNISEKNINGVETIHTYDVFDRNISTVIDPNGLALSQLKFYNTLGLANKTVDLRGFETIYTYDALNRILVERFDPTGTDLISTKVYNRRGLIERSILPTGVITDAEYNTLGLTTKITKDVGGGDFETSLGYNVSGEISAITDPAGNTTAYAYNNFGDIISKTDANNNVTTMEYDDYGVQVKVIDDSGSEYISVYNDRGFLISEIEDNTNLQLTTSFAYDKHGRVIEEVDPEGKKIIITYNRFDQKLSVTDDSDLQANVTLFEYDDATNLLISQTDANNSKTEYEYDIYDRLVKEIYADTKEVSHDYNKYSQRTQTIDQNNNTVDVIYNSLGLLEQIDFTSLPGVNGVTKLTYTYDNFNRLKTASSIGGIPSTITRNYDLMGRVISEVQNIDGVLNTVLKGYDTASRFDTLTYPSGTIVGYTYDALNNVEKIYNKTTLFEYVNYGFNNLNQLSSKTLGNSLKLNMAYDGAERTTSQEWQNVGLVTMAGFDYKYDNVGNRKVEIGLHNANKSAVYDYDTTYKVTGYKQGLLNVAEDDVPTVDFYQDWVQDALGNWSSFDNNGTVDNRSHDSMNQITSTGFTHDDNGNMTSDGTNDYEYDAMNRLIKATVGSTVTEYSYDALNRRVQKEVGGVKTNYIYNNIFVIEEQDDIGVLEKSFIHGEQYIDEIIMLTTGGNDYYYLEDYRNSIIGLSDTSGNILERYEYTVFGERTVLNDDYTIKSSNLIDNDYGFTGRRHDAETGIMYFRGRYYSAQLGRFLSRDPLGYVDGMSLYRGYFGVNGLDPLGQEKKKKKTSKNDKDDEKNLINLVKQLKNLEKAVNETFDKAIEDKKKKRDKSIRLAYLRLLDKIQACSIDDICGKRNFDFKGAAKILTEFLYGKGSVDSKQVIEAFDKALNDKDGESLRNKIAKKLKDKFSRFSAKKFKKLNKNVKKILERLIQAGDIITKLQQGADLDPREQLGTISNMVDLAADLLKDAKALKLVYELVELLNKSLKVVSSLTSDIFVSVELDFINTVIKVTCEDWKGIDVIDITGKRKTGGTNPPKLFLKVLEKLFKEKYNKIKIKKRKVKRGITNNWGDLGTSIKRFFTGEWWEDGFY
ncbi:MAG: hypothetical protein COA79_26100, partial [Planctomycetota bacterium]